MKTALLSVATLAALTSLAAGEPYDAAAPTRRADHYVGAGAAVSGQRALMVGVNFDAGMRLSSTPLFAHARIEVGESGEGNYEQLRGGLEARGCVWGSLLCSFVGIDVGYQHDNVISEGRDWGGVDRWMSEINAHDLLAVPRAGVEFGGRTKLRIAVELPQRARIDEREALQSGETVTAGLSYTW